MVIKNEVDYTTYLHNITRPDKTSLCQHIQFDTDSYLIGVDNHTSYSMTPNVNDFITTILSVNNMYAKGIGGVLKVLG